MSIEVLNPLAVGDLIFPKITRNGEGWSVEPIVLWVGSYKGKRMHYTAATPAASLPGSYPPSVNWLGWCNSQSTKYGHGIKVFVPMREERLLKANEAIRVIKVSLRCAVGEVVEFIINA